MKKMLTIAIVLLLFVGLGGGSVWWYNNKVRRSEPLTLYGNVDIREVQLAFRQGGRLETMAYDEGDAVKAGAELARLDDKPLRDSLANVEADVSRAQAELDRLTNGSRPQDVAQSEQSYASKLAAFRNAQKNFNRQLSLSESGAASQKTLDEARLQRDQAEANLNSAREALALQREGARKEDIDAARASLASVQARLSQAQTSVDDAVLRAPSNGVILTRVVEPGSIVTSSSPIYTLSLVTPVYIRAYIGETDLGKIAPGTRVRIRTDSSSKVYSGQVGFISPKAEFTPRSVETKDLRTDLVYRLRIVVADSDRSLRQGMPVTIEIVGDNASAHKKAVEP